MSGRLSPEEVARRQKWRSEAVVFSLYAGGSWNSDENVRWVEGLGADDWHAIACNYIWDSPDRRPLQAIVNRPDCDRATVMTIYAFASPNYYEDNLPIDEPFLSMNLEIIKILDTISQNFRNDQYYKAAKFKCMEDPGWWRKCYEDRLKANKPTRWLLPDRAYAQTKGEPHKARYHFEHDEFLTPYQEWLQRR